MSFNPPEGILDIGNATLRVGKLEVTETTGLNQGLQNIVKNDLLLTETAEYEYSSNKHWGLKLPTTWVAEFEVKGETDKYVEFNFYNEGSTSNAYGYTLNFRNTTLTLDFDNGVTPLATATIPTIVGTFRKVNIFLERGVIAVYIDGSRVLYYKFGDGYNANLGVPERVISTTGSAFLNLFIEANSSSAAFKNLRIVNGRFISDKTSNVSFIGSLGVGVNSPKESLDIRGNMHFNRVSNVSQISVDSNVVTEYTGPHDRPLRKYPEVPLTQNDESATSGYVASASSPESISSFQAWKAFSAFTSNQNRWQTSPDTYDSNGNWVSGVGATGVQFTDTNGGEHSGEWIKLQLPKSIKLDYIRYLCNYSTFMTKDFVILGSNDDTSWTLLKSVTGGTSIEDVYHTLHINADGYYKYYVWLTTAVNGSTGEVLFNDICFYGYEEGSGSLDTTLKTVYNVPATTGTQLEVYYDAKDLTTMPSIVTDLAGGDQNGTVTGATLDSTNGIDSFKFNGSSQYITSTHGLSVPGQPVHSQCVWFKITGDTGDYQYISVIGTTNQTNQAGLVLLNDGRTLLGNYYGGDRLITTITQNVWYHAVLVYTGTTTDAAKYYINGVEVITSEVVAAPITPTITGTTLRLGANTAGAQELNGSIANFRLYSKALNADQVKELYDYQKDYFLGSKSQVTLYKGHLGVGVTEPSGQLELAGDERIQEYPPRAMTGYETLVEGHGVFCASASSYYNATQHLPWQAFTPAATSGVADGWNSGNNSTGINLGYYAETASGEATSAAVLFEGTRGEWVQLKCPYPIIVKKFAITGRSNGVYGGSPEDQPKSGILYGSNDGNNWDILVNFSGLTYGGASGGAGATGGTEIVEVNATKGYTRLVLQATARVTNFGTDDWINIGQLQYFGTPGPTTLDKGSLSLTRSLDVPRVSRYDVDTETPRPEKLVLDFDTTVHPFNFTSAKDKSGRGNDAFALGGAIYSPADKAYKFDGSSDTLYCNIPTGNSWGSNGTGLPTGDAIYTISCWLKTGASQPNTNPAVFYFGSSWAQSKLAGIFLRDGNKVGSDIGSAHVYTTNAVINVEQWHHVAVVKRGTGNLSTSDSYMGIFVDGVEISAKSQDNNFVQGLDAIDHISIGSDFNGSMGSFGGGFKGLISKPQIWSVALEPSEIKKIYKLGRVGRSLVLADTNIQIGAGHHSSVTSPPYATLDVHGHALISGELHSMEGNFHKMLGFGRGGGHIDHQRTDNCVAAMATATVTNSGHSYVSFAIRKSPNWMPFSVEIYHTGVDHDSSDLFTRVCHAYGRIYGTSVDTYGLIGTSSNMSVTASDMAGSGGDMVRLRVFVNREGRYYGVTMVNLVYYYGIRGRSD